MFCLQWNLYCSSEDIVFLTQPEKMFKLSFVSLFVNRKVLTRVIYHHKSEARGLFERLISSSEESLRGKL